MIHAGSRVLLVNCFTGGFTAKYLALCLINISYKPNSYLTWGSMRPRAFRNALVNKKEPEPSQLTNPGLPFPGLVRIPTYLLAFRRCSWLNYTRRTRQTGTLPQQVNDPQSSIFWSSRNTDIDTDVYSEMDFKRCSWLNYITMQTCIYWPLEWAILKVWIKITRRLPSYLLFRPTRFFTTTLPSKTALST